MDLGTVMASHLAVTRAFAASLCPHAVSSPSRRKRRAPEGQPHVIFSRAQPSSTSAPISTAVDHSAVSKRDPSETLRELAGEELGYVTMAPTALGRGLVTQAPVIRQVGMQARKSLVLSNNITAVQCVRVSCTGLNKCTDGPAPSDV